MGPPFSCPLRVSAAAGRAVVVSIQATRDDLAATTVYAPYRDPGLQARWHTMDRTMIECLMTWPGLTVDRRAVVALEYALIVGLLAVAVLTAASALGASIETAFADLAHLV
jgi:Flp pilus assembly pilin Flp